MHAKSQTAVDYKRTHIVSSQKLIHMSMYLQRIRKFCENNSNPIQKYSSKAFSLETGDREKEITAKLQCHRYFNSIDWLKINPKNWDIRHWNFLSANMLDAMEIIFMIVIVGEFIMGILGNGFIGLVNFVDWVKKRKIYLADIILTSLATSRIGLLFMIFFNGFTMILYPEVFDCENIMRIIDGVWTIINHLNVWFATCLSIFYCLKIANFSHPLFLWLKWRINRVIPIILLASLPISVFFSFLIIENYNEIFKDFILRKYKRNNTSSSVYSKMLLNLGSLFPFTVSLISFFLLILSLWKHVQKRKLNSLDARDPSTEIHLRALKTMISFLILFVIYCLTFFIATSNDFFPESELVMIFVQIIAPIYPLGHTSILIWGNIKLRQTSLNALQQLKHCLQGDISIEQTMQK